MRTSLFVAVSLLVGSTLLACSSLPDSKGSDYELLGPSGGSGSNPGAGSSSPVVQSPTETTDEPSSGNPNDGDLADTDIDQDAGAPPPPPPSGSVHYKGTLSATDKVAFGGKPHCAYKSMMKDVEVELDFVGDRVVGATVKNVIVEEIVPITVCYHDANKPARQDYSYQFVDKGDAPAPLPTQRITLTGASYNTPKATLTLEIKQNGDAYDVTMSWKRVGSDALMSWTLTAVTTARKS
jgi:hypothetical protein